MNRPLQKGTRVSHAQSSAKTPSLRTGFFASLRGGGSGAGSTSRASSAPRLARYSSPEISRQPSRVRERLGVGGGTAVLRLAGLLALAIAALLALASSAFAARGHEFTGTIGTPCTAEPCGPGELKEPSGLAVNEATHDIYVVDKGNDRVQVFSSRGALA